MKCFFHSADLDGHCAGAIVKYHHPDCEMIGVNYGDRPDFNKLSAAERVFVVDFSFPVDDMLRLHRECRLTWIDHHKTAIEDMDGLADQIAGIRRPDFAGCELTWVFCSPQGIKIPKTTPPGWFRTQWPLLLPPAIRLLGRYDVWDHRDPECLPFQYAMRVPESWPDDDNMDLWGMLFQCEEMIPPAWLSMGEGILRYEIKQNAIAAKSAFPVEIMGKKVLCLNRRGAGSKIFDSVVTGKDHYDAVMLFGFSPKRGWQCSIYAVDDCDVSEIARAHGGGGHKGAAGFAGLPVEVQEAVGVRLDRANE
jgi:hypothetical protein